METNKYRNRIETAARTPRRRDVRRAGRGGGRASPRAAGGSDGDSTPTGVPLGGWPARSGPPARAFRAVCGPRGERERERQPFEKHDEPVVEHGPGHVRLGVWVIAHFELPILSVVRVRNRSRGAHCRPAGPARVARASAAARRGEPRAPPKHGPAATSGRRQIPADPVGGQIATGGQI